MCILAGLRGDRHFALLELRHLWGHIWSIVLFENPLQTSDLFFFLAWYLLTHRYTWLSKKYSLTCLDFLFGVAALTGLSLTQEFEYLEFYAGVGNLTRQARACGYTSARFDILDNKHPNPKRKTNYMDLTSKSGFALLRYMSCFHFYISYISQKQYIRCCI